MAIRPTPISRIVLQLRKRAATVDCAVSRCVRLVLFCCAVQIVGAAPALWGQDCADTTLTTASGTFSLPTRNGLYSPGLHCSWKVSVPNARQIMVSVERFNIEEKDQLQIFSSQDSDRPLFRLTGFDLPTTFVVADSSIIVRFMSDTIPQGILRTGAWLIRYTSSMLLASVRVDDDVLNFQELPFGAPPRVLSTQMRYANLLNNLVITPPSGFKVSLSPSGPFFDTLRISLPRDTALSNRLYVQFAPPAAGVYDGRIRLNGGAVEAFITLNALAAPAIYWESSNGPFSGRVHALGVAPGNTLLAATGSGIYRSNSNGAVWLPSSGGLSTKKAQNVYRIVPWQGSICILSEEGVFRSLDSGRSWRAMPQTGIQRRASIHTIANFAGSLFVGTSSGVYKYIPDIDTWRSSSKDLPYDNETEVLALAEHNGRLFAGLSEAEGVYVSLDTGKTWAEASGEKAQSLPFDDWFNVSGFTSVGTRLYALVDITDDVGSVDYSVLYYTDNYGSSWVADNQQGLTDNSYYYYDLLSVGQTLYLATSDGVFRRNNSGSGSEPGAWQQINRGISELTAQALTANGATLYVGTYGGVFRSSNQGASWVPVNQGLTAALVYALEEHRGIILAATEGSGVFRSIDNGITWNAVNSGMPARYIGDIFSNEIDLYACAYADTRTNGVYRSLDNGASWSKLPEFPLPSNFPVKPDVYTVSVDSRGYLFAAGIAESSSESRAALYYSTTNGITWIAPPMPVGGLSDAIWALEEVPGLGMLVGLYGGGAYTLSVSHQTPREASWQKIPTLDGNQDAEYVRAFAVFNNLVYAATDGGLYRLNRNRMRWERVEISPDIDDPAVLSLHIAGGMLYVGTFGAGVWRTAGQSWERVTEGLVTNADIYSLTSDGFNIYAGLSGNAIYRSSLRLPATAARAVLKIADTFIAAPGEFVSIYIQLDTARNLPTELPTISGVLRFNASLLDPGDDLRAEAVVNGERLLPFNAQLKSQRGEIVVLLRLRALLGNSVATPLTLTNLSANGVLLTSAGPGLFTLKGLSDAGGTRLFLAESRPLLSITPNPATAEARISIETFEFGETVLSIANTFGQTLKTFVTPAMEPGMYDFSALTADMPQGIYFVSLQTPTHRITRQLQVVR